MNEYEYQILDLGPSKALADAMMPILREHLSEHEMLDPERVGLHLAMGVWEVLRRQMPGVHWQDKLPVRDAVIRVMAVTARSSFLDGCLPMDIE
jgi:hypothetical protein